MGFAGLVKSPKPKKQDPAPEPLPPPPPIVASPVALQATRAEMTQKAKSSYGFARTLKRGVGAMGRKRNAAPPTTAAPATTTTLGK